jgi:hypothetical protein
MARPGPAGEGVSGVGLRRRQDINGSAAEGASMEETVRFLESLLPELAAVGESLSRTLPGVASRTFTYRHAHTLHSLGLSCFPAGSDELDERCVALIVNVFEHDGLSLKGYVQWQAPSFHTEAETAVCENPSADDLAAFHQSVRGLSGPLQAAVQRAKPPDAAIKA